MAHLIDIGSGREQMLVLTASSVPPAAGSWELRDAREWLQRDLHPSTASASSSVGHRGTEVSLKGVCTDSEIY